MSKILDIRNPLVWLRRIQHRRGYGVHSPFAFNMLIQVVYAPGQYYAYRSLDALFSRRDRLMFPRRRAVDRLLFRLSNALQPRSFCALGGSERAICHIKAGCSTLHPVAAGSRNVDMLYVAAGGFSELDAVAEGGFVIVDHLRKNRSLWKHILKDDRFTVTFDLHDVGLAFLRPDLLPDHYIVNW